MANSAQADSSTQADSTAQADSTPAGPTFNEYSRLMVVAIDTSNANKLVWNAQTVPNGPWGAKWTPINDNPYMAMDAGSTQDGRVAAVALTTDGSAIHYIDEQKDIVDVEKWNAPVNLGLPPAAHPITQIQMLRDADGRIEVFARDKFGLQVWWIFQNPDRVIETKVPVEIDGKKVEVPVQEKAPPTEPWSEWQEIKAPGDFGINGLVTANTADGRICLFAYVSSGAIPAALYQTEQTKAVTTTPAEWSAWLPLMANSQVIPYSAELDEQGAINLSGLHATNVFNIKETPPNSNTWGPWSGPGVSNGGKPILNLTSGRDGNGNLTMVAVDEDGHYYSRQQLDAENNQWTGWQLINTEGDLGTLQMAYNSDGRLSLFVVAGLAPLRLRCISQISPNSTEWEAIWTELAAGGITLYSVVRDLTPVGAAEAAANS